MTNLTAREIAKRHGVTRQPKNGRYRIPEVCHGSTTSKDLSIWDGDGGSIGAKCHSQVCGYQRILDSLEVEFVYEGRTHRYGKGNAAPVTRRRGPNKDLSGNGGSNRGLLVRLDDADSPAKTVVLVEGEKAFDALSAYGSDHYTAAHWVGGTGAVDVADYSPLKDRLVVLWPDADDVGRAAMEKAGIRADAEGAFALSMVDTSELPDKADAADVDGKAIKALLGAAEEWTPPPIVHPSNEAMAKGAAFSHDAEGLEAAFLTLRLELRANARGGRIEVRHLAHGDDEALSFVSNVGLMPDPAGWAHLSDPAAAWCLNYWTRHNVDTNGKRYKLSEEAFRRAILALTAGKNRDPVLEYLNALPAWDGTERLPALFTAALGAPATPLNGEIAKVLMIGLVGRTTNPGSKHDEVPVLVGKQGGGKSTFCEELLPPEYPGWHRTLDNLHAEDQKRVERIDNAAIVEFAELRVLGGYGAVKSFLSDRYDSYRLPYQRAAQTLPRRWVGIATANDEGEGVLPDDPTGNRRYNVIKVAPPGATSEEQSAHVREYLGANRTQLWAEAVARFERGEKSYLAGEYEKGRDEINVSYTRANQPLEEIAAELTAKHATAKPAKGVPVTLADLMVEGGLADDAADAQGKVRSAGRKLAGYLTREAWERSRVMRGGVQRIVWTPPQRTTAEPPPAPSATGINVDGFTVATVGPVKDSAVMHAHFCNKAEGWVHHAEIGLEPMNCESCKAHLSSEHNAPPPGQGRLLDEPSIDRPYHT